MWQSVMIPAKTGGRRYQGLSPGESRGGAFICFAILGLLHIAVLILAGFSGRTRIPEDLKQQPLLLVDLDFPGSLLVPKTAEPEPLPPPPPPPPEAVPETLPKPDPEPGLAEAEELAPPAAVPENAESAAGFDKPAGQGAGRQITEAEYIALIMRRLEERKVYPLAMRKRGIQGDMPVSFTIHADGSLGELRPGENPSHPFLVQAALETVKSASPFPVMEGMEGDFSLRLTIRYQLE
jgi:protein TonB